MDFLTSGAATAPENTPQENEDLRPEYCRYKDEGCEYSPECLNCPFPQCLYDEPRGRQRWMRELRDHEIARRFKDGEKVNELAEEFEVSLRTVQRALNKGTRGLKTGRELQT